MPLGKFGQQRQPLGQRGGDLTWPQPGGQGPDRLDRRDTVRLVDRHQMLGMGDGQPAVEDVQLAGDQQFRAGRRLRFPGEPEKHQFRGAGFVLDDNAPGLAGVRGALMAYDLHGERGDDAGLGGADRRPGAAVEVRLGHVKQQIDDPIAAGGSRDQRRDGGPYAAQTCQGREKRGKRLGVHGLTVLRGTAI